MNAASSSIRVYLSTPTSTDAAPFLHAVQRSRSLHGDWVSPPSTEAEFDDYLSRSAEESNVSYFLRLKLSAEIVGVINLSNIVRGCFCSGCLGYYALSPNQGKGYMREGLKLVVKDAFGRLDLHRVEANIQPENKASIALVRSCGFQHEGYSPRYLKIAGEWRDHERWALLSET